MGVDRRVVLDPAAGAGRELSWTLTPGGPRGRARVGVILGNNTDPTTPVFLPGRDLREVR